MEELRDKKDIKHMQGEKQNGERKLLSITTLNVSGSCAPNKIRDWQNGSKSHNPTTHCVQETHFRAKGTNRLKVKGRGLPWWCSG